MAWMGKGGHVGALHRVPLLPPVYNFGNVRGAQPCIRPFSLSHLQVNRLPAPPPSLWDAPQFVSRNLPIYGAWQG